MRIFISYRRSDTQHFAGRIADRLRSDKEIDEVFLDVDRIAPGEDFEEKINTEIDGSSACLLLIGQHWLGRDDENDRTRIFEERDFIRLETRAALASGRQVIPVLVEDAAMPSVEELPEDLHRLPRLNGISIRHLHFNKDAENLIDALLGRVQRSGDPPVSPQRRLLGHVARGLAGAGVAAIVLLGAGIIHNAATDGRSLSESLGGSGQVWLLILGTVVLGALAPLALRRLGKRRR